MIRVGQGCDIHALVPGRKMILGGVDIAHGSAATGSKLAKPPGGGATSTGFHAYSVSVPSFGVASGVES